MTRSAGPPAHSASWWTVHQAVKARVGQGTVKILVNGPDLTVMIINSPLRGLPADRKKAKAPELAGAAYDAYARRARVARVQIVFAIQARVPFVRYTDSNDAHIFDASALRVPADTGPTI